MLIFTARCYAERGYATVSCLSLRPSVTLRYDFHTGWNTSKTISRLNSLGLLFRLTPTWAICCNETPPKLGWNRVTEEHKQAAISPKRCKIRPRLLWRLIGSLIHVFDWYQNQRPWMTLNGISRDCTKFFEYPLLSQERVKLRTSNLAGTFTVSLRPNKRPFKILEKREHGRIQGLPKVLSTPYYLRNG